MNLYIPLKFIRRKVEINKETGVYCTHLHWIKNSKIEKKSGYLKTLRWQSEFICGIWNIWNFACDDLCITAEMLIWQLYYWVFYILIQSFWMLLISNEISTNNEHLFAVWISIYCILWWASLGMCYFIC